MSVVCPPRPSSTVTRMARLVVLGLALPAALALVPGHPYGRSLRARAAADVRWPGVVAMAEGEGGPEAPTKRADELLRALQDADMRGVEVKEPKEPDFLSVEGLKQEFGLLRKGEGVRARLPRTRSVCIAALTASPSHHHHSACVCAGDVRVHRGVRADLRLLPRDPAAHRRAALHPITLHVPRL